MSDGRQLKPDEISDLLAELLARVARRGRSADVYIVGGAALTLQLGRPTMTPDIDMVLNPAEDILAAAAEMADEFGLEPDWVNGRAFAFVSVDTEQDTEAAVLDFPGHRVRVASPRYLLAMKIAASRAKDRDDINALIKTLGITSAVEIVELAIEILGEESMAFSYPSDRLREYLLLDAEAALRDSKRTDALWP